MKSKRPANNLTTYQMARLQVVGHRAVQAEINSVLGKYGLNTSQWIILGWLQNHPEGLRITTLAEILDVETPLITSLMQLLIQARFVSLKTDPSDRRAKLAALTEKGVIRVNELEPILVRHLTAFDKNIKSGDMEAYFHVLQQFIYASKLQD